MSPKKLLLRKAEERVRKCEVCLLSNDGGILEATDFAEAEIDVEDDDGTWTSTILTVCKYCLLFLREYFVLAPGQEFPYEKITPYIGKFPQLLADVRQAKCADTLIQVHPRISQNPNRLLTNRYMSLVELLGDNAALIRCGGCRTITRFQVKEEDNLSSAFFLAQIAGIISHGWRLDEAGQTFICPDCIKKGLNTWEKIRQYRLKEQRQYEEAYRALHSAARVTDGRKIVTVNGTSASTKDVTNP